VAGIGRLPPIRPRAVLPDQLDRPGCGRSQQAQAVCARCPVRPHCLDFALATGQEFGIWGGHDERQLRLLRREGRAAATEVPESAG